MRRWWRLLWVAVGIAVVAPPTGVAAAAPLRAADKEEIKRLVRTLGPGTGLAITDSAGRTLLDVRGSKRRTLGSLTKLFTTSAALLSLRTPPRTTVALTAPVLPDGTLDGDVVLRGEGDAGLGDAGLIRLRDAVIAAGVRRLTGRVVGDGSLFDASLGGPATDGAFDAEFDGVVGALLYERGRATPRGPFQRDPAAAAAARFDDLLEAAGVVVPRAPGSGTRTAGRLLGEVRGDLPALLKAANTSSSAVTAEVLGKLVAVRRGNVPATSAAAARAVTDIVRSRLGIRPVLRDSAGFVARSQASPRDVVRLLRRMDRRTAFARSLARAGTGTLRGRGVPVGCRAKTGTLRTARATGLAGICRGRVFAVLTVGASTARARRAQDRISQIVARRG